MTQLRRLWDGVVVGFAWTIIGCAGLFCVCCLLGVLAVALFILWSVGWGVGSLVTKADPALLLLVLALLAPIPIALAFERLLKWAWRRVE